MSATGEPFAEGGPPSPTATATGTSTADAPPPGPPRTCPGGTLGCTAQLPQGWVPVLYTSAASCPSNFASHDVVTNPTAAADACKCSCNIDTQPQCGVGNLTGTTGPAALTCDTSTAPSYSFPGSNTFSNCLGVQGGTPPANARYQVLPSSPGSCSPVLTPNDASLKATAGRWCEARECYEEICSGIAQPGFLACIKTDGDQACPAGAFTQKTLVGSKPTLACSGCTGCVNSVTCSPATLRYYSEQLCFLEIAHRAVDGQCNTSGTSAFKSVKYDANVTDKHCNVQTPAAMTLDLNDKQTICCRP